MLPPDGSPACCGKIAYIRNLERNLGLKKESIYAAALLHDIGKYAQYEEGIPHEIKSAEIAGIILSDMPERIRFTPAEQQEILTAIRGHRKLREKRYPAGKSAI